MYSWITGLIVFLALTITGIDLFAIQHDSLAYRYRHYRQPIYRYYQHPYDPLYYNPYYYDYYHPYYYNYYYEPYYYDPYTYYYPSGGVYFRYGY